MTRHLPLRDLVTDGPASEGGPTGPSQGFQGLGRRGRQLRSLKLVLSSRIAPNPNHGNPEGTGNLDPRTP